MPTKCFPDICPMKQTKIITKKLPKYTHQKITKKVYDPCLFARAEVWKSFGWHFGRNDDLINSFWIQLTFSFRYVFGIWTLMRMSDSLHCWSCAFLKRDKARSYLFMKINKHEKIQFIKLDISNWRRFWCNKKQQSGIEWSRLSSWPLRFETELQVPEILANKLLTNI